MKRYLTLTTRAMLSCQLVLGSSLSVSAQGTFQNLDFESAQIPDVPFGTSGTPVPASIALPGWSVYYGETQITTVGHNDSSLGGVPLVSLLGPQWVGGIYQGAYSVLLQASSFPPVIVPAIAQIGQIPDSAKSLRFRVSYPSIGVSFAGQGIALRLLDGGPFSDYYTMGGDISLLSGRVGELRFQGSAFLDFIQFSDQPIPEPSGAALLGLGFAALAWQAQRKRFV